MCLSFSCTLLAWPYTNQEQGTALTLSLFTPVGSVEQTETVNLLTLNLNDTVQRLVFYYMTFIIYLDST